MTSEPVSPTSALARVASRVRPSPSTARDWVRDELARPEYHRSLLARLSSWLQDRWLDLQSRAAGASALSTAVVVVLAVLLALLLVLVVSRLRRDPASFLAPVADLGAGQVLPQEHRRAADAALAQGRFEIAIVEGFRAVAARAARRGVLEERPGRTAHELAAELAPVYPEHASHLLRASTTFDEVFYGDRSATADGARSVLALDDALRSARPGATRTAERADAGAVPR